MPNWTEEQLAAHLAGRSAERPPANKYRVAPKAERTIGSLTFASKAEASAYQTLLALQVAGEVTKLELQPEYKFPPGITYRGDFRVTYKDGSVVTIDVKGVNTPVFVIKRKLLAYFYPDVKLEIWKNHK